MTKQIAQGKRRKEIIKEVLKIKIKDEEQKKIHKRLAMKTGEEIVNVKERKESKGNEKEKNYEKRREE